MHPRLVGSWPTALLLAILCLVDAQPAAAQSVTQAPRAQGFALGPQLARLFDVNRVACPLDASGEICGSEFDHSADDWAAWPRGTANRHIWASGLRLAGVVAADGGAWAGDTSAATFFELRGTGEHGEPLEPIHFATDGAARPAAADVPATGAGSELFAPSLRGRASASDGDAWFLTWDGNPALGAGTRPHPLGVMVETRVMGWRGPQWNNDIIYVAYTIYNVTASDPAVYAGIRPELREVAAAQGARFQRLNEAESGIALPDGGYTIQSLHAGMVQDPQISSDNHASVAFPLATSLAWQPGFDDSQGPPWELRPELHSPPFLPAPGFTGMAVLDAPAGAAELHFFSGHTGSSIGFPPPSTAAGVLRHMAGVPDPVLDGTCNQPEPVASRVCWLNTIGNDAQYMMSTPATTLAPGEGRTFVVAFVFAAPVAVPSFTPSPAANVAPGNPLELGDAAAMLDGVNLVDSIAGYRGFTDRDGDGAVSAGEMDLVPGSFYGKVRIAQVLFANGFVSPQTPEAPDFHLIPGDDRVTVVWRPSVSEQTGDPFFAVARDAVLPDGSPNPLYDPNYREFDVEGYRIYRGRSSSPDEMELVAQFDYRGTSIVDHAGQVDPRIRCAPELGVTDDCPIAFDPVAPGVARTAGVEHPLVGHLPQARLGDRYRTEGGLVLAASMDSVAGPGLEDSGVPFAWIDDGVRNNFRYYYTVTAFDVNSWQSGPASAESSLLPKPVTPVRPASNARFAAEPVAELLGADGTALEPLDGGWTIDPETGRFSGPPPPTDAVTAIAEGFVAELAPATSIEARIDSVLVLPAADSRCAGESNVIGTCELFHLTVAADGEETISRIPVPAPVWSSLDGVSRVVRTVPMASVEADPVQAARYGVAPGTPALSASVHLVVSQTIDYSSHEGQAARRNRFGSSGGISPGGSRWFAGTDETVDDPAYGIRVGHIPGVDTIFSPIPWVDMDVGTEGLQAPANSSIIQWFGYGFAGLGRQADMRLTWGPNGTVASFEDVTHRVPVDFKPDVQAGYGFVQDGNGNGMIDWGDFHYPGNVCEYWVDQSAGDFPPGSGCAAVSELTPLLPTAQISATSTSFETDWPQTGRGFGLYVAGQAFIFEMAGGALPAAGEVWTLRQYSGRVRADPRSSATADPNGYDFLPVVGARSAAVPGLRVRVSIPENAVTADVTSNSLRQVHTVPDPFYLASGFDAATGDRAVKFVNLPDHAIIRIYSSSGVLVDIVEHFSDALSGTADWNLRNRDGTPVAPGVYFYHIESGGARAIGKFTVVTYAP